MTTPHQPAETRECCLWFSLVRDQTLGHHQILFLTEFCFCMCERTGFRERFVKHFDRGLVFL